MARSIKIPCVMMRGGTSRGPYFLADDLPEDTAARDEILLSVMGSGHALEIDGIGGGNPVTSKVAIVRRSQRPDADVDYLFAQVKVHQCAVDTSPNCGNMLAGVGPFAIEAGIVAPQTGETGIRIYNVNTGKIIEARVQTPGGEVTYAGDTAISGVPGTAAPVLLTFLDAAGSKTGALLPTGRSRDCFDGIDVSCVDAAMPIVLIRAADLGKSGSEAWTDLNADAVFLSRLEQLRIKAGTAMGIANVAEKVIPKPVLIAPGEDGATLTVRYFMPHDCHPALAITGSVAIASACCTAGTIAAEMAGTPQLSAMLSFAHPSGRLDVFAEPGTGAAPKVSVVRTARRLFEGMVIAEVERSSTSATAQKAFAA